MMRWITRGFAVIGAVVVAWISLTWARLSAQRAREATERATYGSWPSHR